MANDAKQFVRELVNDDTERSTHSDKKRVPLIFIISLVVNLSLLMSIFQTIQGPDLSFFYAIFCLNLTLTSLFCYYAMKYGLPKATVYFIVLSILSFAIFFAKSLKIPEKFLFKNNIFILKEHNNSKYENIDFRCRQDGIVLYRRTLI